MKLYIRDLFLVTIIVAVCLAWWLDHRRLSERIEDLQYGEWNFSMSSGWVMVPFDREGFEKAIQKKMNGLPTSQAPAPNPANK